VTTERELREKLRKITALFEGAATPGEQAAAAAALGRIRAALASAERTEGTIEMQFTLHDPWQRRLFSALCRRHGLHPYRYLRQHRTTLMVKTPRTFMERKLWPEFLELKQALDEYLNEATERILREEVYGDAGEAKERAMG
jgi:hypothetical protein